MNQPASDGQGIYAIRNQENGAVYVGSAHNFVNRWKTHRWPLLRGKHQTPALQADWNAYGPDVFTFDPVEHIEREFDLSFAEHWWFDHYRNAGVRLYNRYHPRHLTSDERQEWLASPLVQLRIQCGMSVYELSKAAKVSEGTLRRIELGRIPGSPQTLAKLVAALGAEAKGHE